MGSGQNAAAPGWCPQHVMDAAAFSFCLILGTLHANVLAAASPLTLSVQEDQGVHTRRLLSVDGAADDLQRQHLGLIIALAVVLALLSAVFSGLTLGLMTLDVIQLRVLMDTAKKRSEDPRAVRDGRRAQRIYRLRKDGNLLLVTLVMSNVGVNAAFSIITSDLTSGLIGFLLSTVIITFVGEIVPQAVCSRHGLATGYYLIPLLSCVEVVLYIIVKPVAVLLDWMLGKDLGTQYTREQLKALFAHYEKEIKLFGLDETRILSGGLEIAAKTVETTMTPLDQVFGLDADRVLDFDTALELVMSGYSRVPVLDRSRDQCIIGVLYTKDLALVDPELRLPVRSLLPVFGRSVYGVDRDASLLSTLADFKKGHSHLAVVREVVTPSHGDPYYRHVGIITLEDIIEEIIQDEILDEYECPIEHRQKKPPVSASQETGACSVADASQNTLSAITPASLGLQQGGDLADVRTTAAISEPFHHRAPSEEPHNTDHETTGGVLTRLSDTLPRAQRSPTQNVKRAAAAAATSGDAVRTKHHTRVSETQAGSLMVTRLRLFSQRCRAESLSQDEVAAVSFFLASTQPAFQAPFLKQRTLHMLLVRCPLISPTDQFYTRGQPSESMLLILQGRVHVTCGHDEITCVVGPWKVLGVKALGPPPDVAHMEAEVALCTTHNPSGRTPPLNTHSAVVLQELDARLTVWASTYVYCPDFSARPDDDTQADRGLPMRRLRCLQVTRQDYVQAVRGGGTLCRDMCNTGGILSC